MGDELSGISAHHAQSILDRMGSTGQPAERSAHVVNVGTDEYLDVLRDEYLRPMAKTGRNSTFKLVQAPFGGGKTQFLHCLRELAWQEGFVTALVGLSPKECPFDRPVSIYQEVARQVELPSTDPEDSPRQGLDTVLRQLAVQRIQELGESGFRDWIKSDFANANIESRSFSRGVRGFLEAVAQGEADDEDLLGDYLRGELMQNDELRNFRLREKLEDANAFRWLRSMVQVLAALGQPGVVLMFDEMDRNMSLSVSRRRAMGDNLRQMIDYCGQSLLPGVVWCYAVPPEFMDTIVPEYPALAQRLKGAARFSNVSPLQPIIDLDRVPLGAVDLLKTIGLRLLALSARAYEHEFDEKLQEENITALARELGEAQFESGTRRQFVKAVVSMIEAQRREGESLLSAADIRTCAGNAATAGPAEMPDEVEF